ncbi:MAG: YIP1 family protein [Defluviitaleaceae bacterium]|nr:YIP1 family protein [Defluviitaleaceae bacterium]MCL2274833.1 YIP1 family protein [Defluviitaleaceae bacterium]
MRMIEREHLRGLFSIIASPIEAFDEMRHQGKGSLELATLLYLLFFFAVIANRQWTGYLFNQAHVERLNIFIMMALSLGLVLLWIIANMAVCTLSDGEGSLSDVYVTTAYALLPFLLMTPVIVLLSNVMSLGEGTYYTLMNFVKFGWTGVLLFTGNMSAHQFTFKKTVFTSFLTIAGILIILFMMFLAFALVTQLYQFIRTFYNEIMFM